VHSEWRRALSPMRYEAGAAGASGGQIAISTGDFEMYSEADRAPSISSSKCGQAKCIRYL
jgi:hypothetical protein